MNLEFKKDDYNRALMACQYENDGYHVNWVYNPPDQFQCYSGVLNLLDRDHWNNKLNDRNFLLNYPPHYNIVYPQNSSPCINPDCYKVLENPNLNQRSADYWEKYNQSFNPCQNEGFPVHPEQKIYLKFQKQIAKCDRKDPKENPNNYDCRKECGKCCVPPLPVLEEGLPKADQKCLTQEYPNKPWIYGINRNVDVESKLFRLNYLNNEDCYPNNLKNYPEFTDPCTKKVFDETYFPDNREEFRKLTPRLFHNTTKIKNNYPIDVNYQKYNEYINQANQCLSQCQLDTKCN